MDRRNSLLGRDVLKEFSSMRCEAPQRRLVTQAVRRFCQSYDHLAFGFGPTVHIVNVKHNGSCARDVEHNVLTFRHKLNDRFSQACRIAS